MENFVKLNSLKNGEKTIVYNIINFDEKMNYRLIELGFVKGEKIEIIKNFKKAKNMLIVIRGYVLSLDYSLAEKIIVYGVK